MKKSIYSQISFIISIIILLACVLILIILPSNNPYINESSIVYELEYAKNDSGDYIYDENNNLTYKVSSIQVEIINASSKKIQNYELVLRYCREDRYPEAYTAPVIVSINPYEKKIIEIENFRNTCIYNESYHIESDGIEGFYFDVKNYNNEIEFIKAAFIVLPIALISTIISLIEISIKSKKDKGDSK